MEDKAVYNNADNELMKILFVLKKNFKDQWEKRNYLHGME